MGYESPLLGTGIRREERLQRLLVIQLELWQADAASNDGARRHYINRNARHRMMLDEIWDARPEKLAIPRIRTVCRKDDVQVLQEASDLSEIASQSTSLLKGLISQHLQAAKSIKYRRSFI